jgi:hypothetical protein
MHGGAPAALLVRAMEAVPADLPMRIARVTVEFPRPVPITPLAVGAELADGGRRVQRLRASLTAAGTEVARATAVRIREQPVEGISPPPPEKAPLSPADARVSKTQTWFGFGAAMEIRVAHGSVLKPGAATIWFRLLSEIVAGEIPSPLMRVVAAADFGNGISHVLDFREHLFINADLTVYLHRHPRGEWVCLEAVTHPEPDGVGLAESRIWDESGPIGRSLQALLLGAREGDPPRV